MPVNIQLELEKTFDLDVFVELSNLEAQTMALLWQILDPLMSPSLTSLGAVDVVQRYNACLRYCNGAGRSASGRTNDTSESTGKSDSESRTVGAWL